MNRFVFNCNHCNSPLEAGEDLIGLELQCIYCFKNLVVPSPAPVQIEESIKPELIPESATVGKVIFLV